MQTIIGLKVMGVLLVFLVFISCKSKNELDTEIHFIVTYQDQPLVAFETHQYPDGTLFYFTRFSFFIEDLQLRNSERTVKLIDRAYVNLSPALNDATRAVIGTQVFAGKVEEGQYQLNLSIGVNEKENAKGPSGRSSRDPLSEGSEYWPAWNSYIFNRIEGWLDNNGDGQYTQGITLHLGGDEVYRTINVPGQVTIHDEFNSINLVIALDRIFGDTGEWYDLINFSQLHSLHHLPQMTALSDRFEQCFTIGD